MQGRLGSALSQIVDIISVSIVPDQFLPRYPFCLPPSVELMALFPSQAGRIYYDPDIFVSSIIPTLLWLQTLFCPSLLVGPEPGPHFGGSQIAAHLFLLVFFQYNF